MTVAHDDRHDPYDPHDPHDRHGPRDPHGPRDRHDRHERHDRPGASGAPGASGVPIGPGVPHDPGGPGHPADRHGADDEGDALMLALTGAPVPPSARGDERFLAEHAAAVADVAALRDHLRTVGEALARGPGDDAPPPRPRPVRRAGPGAGVRRRALLALAAMLAAGLLGGLVWLGASGGPGAGNDAGAGAAKGDGRSSDAGAGAPSGGGEGEQHDDDAGKLSPEGYVACARLIVEGTVESVETLPGGLQDRITLDVSRSYKPAEAPDEVTFVLDVTADPPLRAGDRALIGVPKGEASPDLWTTGADIAEDRAWILKALPKARDRTC
ncbi:hypothetical protein [Streptomyces longispororuber]|uniref:hypothetical protein n=1 Tax=Streptomyces longispororuber TaxID=68230 RepID=UPI003700D4BF